MGKTAMIEHNTGYAWLSGDFIRGYTKAIQDIKEVFAYVNADIAPRKVRWKYDLIVKLLDLFLEHRVNFRENRDGFIRWNTTLKNLEYFERKD